MGLRPWWTEERFEKWFKARFGRWINERFDAELEQRLQARDTATNSQFQGRFDVLFKARFEAAFHEQIKTWQDDGLPGVDAWVNNFFDNLFTVYANTWGDGDGFRQRFDERFDERFNASFEERLESEVRARVANELADRIDRRIKQWLEAVHQELVHAAESPADRPSGVTAKQEQPDRESGEQGPPTATAKQLAAYLKKKPLGVSRIRELLKGQEIPGTYPASYPLDPAAGTLLSRKTRGGRVSQRDIVESRPDGEGS